MEIDLEALNNPAVLVTVVAIAALAVTLTLAVARTLRNPARQATFRQALATIQSSELDIDTALNKDESTRRLGWFDYWASATAKTGKIVVDPNSPGRTVAGLAVFAALFGAIVAPGGILGLLAGPALAVGAYWGWLNAAASKRVVAMERQLPQLLTGLRANLQAGSTAQQAIPAVADDLPSPLGDELRILKEDLNVATSLDEALLALAGRVPSREMQFLVASIQIAIRSGADLDPQLETIQGIVLQRTRIRQKLRGAVAQVKPTKWLAYLSVPGMFLFSISNVDNRAFWLGSGFIFLILAGILYGAGGFVIRTMVKSVENT